MILLQKFVSFLVASILLASVVTPMEFSNTNISQPPSQTGTLFENSTEPSFSPVSIIVNDSVVINSLSSFLGMLGIPSDFAVSVFVLLETFAVDTVNTGMGIVGTIVNVTVSVVETGMDVTFGAVEDTFDTITTFLGWDDAQSTTDSSQPSFIPSTDPSTKPLVSSTSAPTEQGYWSVDDQGPTTTPSETTITTTAPTQTDPWYVEKASVTFDVDDSGTPRMRIRHAVGSGADDVEASVLFPDCATPVPTDDPIFVVPESARLMSAGVAEFAVGMDASRLGDSALYRSKTNRVELCTVIELIESSTGTSVSFRHSRVSLTLDMSSGFYVVSLDMDGVQIDDYGLEHVSLYRINACQCQVSFECDEVPAMIEQNGAVGVCLSPSSPDAQFTNFNMTIEGNKGFAYSPIIVDEEGHMTSTAFTFVEVRGGVTRVSTQVLSGLFLEGSDQIVVSGVGRLSLDGAADRKRLVGETTESKRFEMVVFLQTLQQELPLPTNMFSTVSAILQHFVSPILLTFCL